jgi:hypothetical protein
MGFFAADRRDAEKLARDKLAAAPIHAGILASPEPPIYHPYYSRLGPRRGAIPSLSNVAGWARPRRLNHCGATFLTKKAFPMAAAGRYARAQYSALASKLAIDSWAFSISSGVKSSHL